MPNKRPSDFLMALIAPVPATTPVSIGGGCRDCPEDGPVQGCCGRCYMCCDC